VPPPAVPAVTNPATKSVRRSPTCVALFLRVTTTRKIPKRLGAPAAAQIIDDLAHWHVHAPAASDVLAAIGIHQRTGASFWDAMILRSAKELGCQILYSEDLDTGQDYAGVEVRNPFLT
jgi:predicted nucleic acid-binding protein